MAEQLLPKFQTDLFQMKSLALPMYLDDTQENSLTRSLPSKEKLCAKENYSNLTDESG